jgi:ribonucleoside-diphosphate reductase alpha chain
MSCSKTINLPNETTVEEIAELYKKVYKMELKGVTTFRDGCRQGVLETKKTKRRKKTAKYKEHHKGYLIDIQSGIAYCPNCKAEQNKGFVLDSGCAYCSECGWGACK